MRIGKRETGVGAGKLRRRSAYRPVGERLEERQLLTGFAIDLINIAGNDTTAGPGPYGILEAGLTNNGGVGYASAVVGDVNGDGFNDFVFGGPTIQGLSTGPVLGSGNGAVYLVFGSQRSDGTNFNWLNLAAQQRVGSLDQLGNLNQNNPVNGSPGFPFNGVTFTASQNPNNLLGASIAAVGDINGDGFADFLIGAPGGLDSTGSFPNAGRAYLVYGSAALANLTIKSVDFDATSQPAGVNFITFVNDLQGSFTGYSVGAVNSFFNPPLTDIVIGAPLASLNGLANNGAVYVIQRSNLTPAQSRTINLSNVGQGGSSNIPGIIFAGANSGDQAGASVAGIGNFDGDTNQVGLGIGDLAIGATQSQTGAGLAYVIYGGASLLNQGIVQNGVNNISLLRVLPGSQNQIPGAIFTGANTGDQTGFAVSSGGDFNADGLADVMIGSPFFNGPAGVDSGRVNLIFGRSINSAAGRIVGVNSLSNLPSTVTSIQFNGPALNAQAGFSMAPVGSLNADNINEVLIGAPGFLNGQGIVYIIPGNQDLQGTVALSGAQASPVSATLITLSQPSTNNFLGSSVSGSLVPNASNQTVDADARADFTIGAAGFNLGGSRVLAGGGYLLEGALVPVANIVSSAITSPIAVQDYPSASVINPSTPADLTFYILSSGSSPAGFQPFAYLNPDTITVNNVALPDPSTWFNAGDLDGDGIDDAGFIFSPRTLLGLPQNSNVTITIAGRTLTSAPVPFSNQRYTGSIGVRTTGGVTPPAPPGLSLSFGPQFVNRNVAAPRFGERMLPQLQVINRARWAPITTRLAYRQWMPQGNFGYRQRNFFHAPNQQKRGTRTLASNVFTRGRFPQGVYIGGLKYKVPVIGAGQRHIYS